MGSTEFFFFLSFFFSGGGEYTHILREIEDLYIVLDTVHSTPPPIHGPSFSHSVAFSLDRQSCTRDQLYLLFPHSLSSTYILPIVLPRTLLHLSTSSLFRYFFFFLLFLPFNHLHSRAFMFVVFLIFSNI